MAGFCGLVCSVFWRGFLCSDLQKSSLAGPWATGLQPRAACLFLSPSWRCSPGLRIGSDGAVTTAEPTYRPTSSRAASAVCRLCCLLAAVLAGSGPGRAGWGLRKIWVGAIFLFATVFLYALIGIYGRTSDASEYYVAGRRIPAMYNGMAVAADWMSAASFISMAGGLYLQGFSGRRRSLAGWSMCWAGPGAFVWSRCLSRLI